MTSCALFALALGGLLFIILPGLFPEQRSQSISNC